MKPLSCSCLQLFSQFLSCTEVKPNQIALAWLLHRAPNIILIPGTTTIAHSEENIAAASITFTSEEIAMLN